MEAVDEGLFAGTGNCTDYSGKSEKTGTHHMMTGQNPIYIISEGEA